MAKIILLALGLLCAYWVLKSYRRNVDRRAAPPAAKGEDMVRCDHCGVHLPRSESVASRGRHFCSQEHRLHQDGP